MIDTASIDPFLGGVIVGIVVMAFGIVAFTAGWASRQR